MIGAATYSAGLISQSFWFLEFKKAVRLRQEGLNYDEIKKKCVEENLFGAAKEKTYRIYFVDGNGEKVSNEHLYVADKKDKDTVKRVFRLRFSFKNKKYSKAQKYYLVAYDDNNELEVLRYEIIMDIAFADDFDFGF